MRLPLLACDRAGSRADHPASQFFPGRSAALEGARECSFGSHGCFTCVGSLLALASDSADVVVFSLVLSYLPLPSQRGAMIAKARSLLPTPQPLRLFEEGGHALPESSDWNVQAAGDQRRGMLLLVETFSVDKPAKSWQEQHVCTSHSPQHFKTLSQAFSHAKACSSLSLMLLAVFAQVGRSHRGPWIHLLQISQASTFACPRFFDALHGVIRD